MSASNLQHAAVGTVRRYGSKGAKRHPIKGQGIRGQKPPQKVGAGDVGAEQL
jgi:hypothetical protein